MARTYCKNFRVKTGIPCNEVLAHTDYDELTDKELAQNCGLNKTISCWHRCYTII